MSENLVIDNGAGSLKIGFAGEPTPRLVCPNLTFRSKADSRFSAGDALLTRDDILCLVLRRPFDKGYLVNPDLQKEIWTKLIKSHLKISPVGRGLVVTEPPFNFKPCRDELLKIVFDLGFESVLIKTPAELSFLYALSVGDGSLSEKAETGVVVDAGFSFCHVVPFCKSEVFWDGVRRIDFGGKAMTNYFKELVSFRSLHLMDEPYLVETIKDALCFVSQDVKSDLQASRQKAWDSKFYREFVLPDGVTNLRGRIRSEAVQSEQEDKEQILAVNNERFLVPEVLFNPSDIGLPQAGLPEAIVQAVEAAPSFFRPLLYGNVVLTGGLVSCPGFTGRLEKELRSLVDVYYDLRVVTLEDPALCAWKGGSQLGSSSGYSSNSLKKRQSG